MEVNTSVERKVEPAKDSDIPYLVEIYFNAFQGRLVRSVFPDTEGGRRWVRQAFEKQLDPRYEGGPETKTLVSRGPDGTPVALAIYRIWQAGSDPSKRIWRARWPSADGNPDMNDEGLNNFYGPTDKAHDFLLGDRAHVHLEVLGTLEAHQKQGHGKALVKWGTQLADELGVECYLDASPVGRPLYAANGYVVQDVGDILTGRSVYPMVRPAKPQDL